MSADFLVANFDNVTREFVRNPVKNIYGVSRCPDFLETWSLIFFSLKAENINNINAETESLRVCERVRYRRISISFPVSGGVGKRQNYIR